MNGTCEETTGMIGDMYLRCGRPAVAVIQHRGRSEGPYRMCRECTYHNCKNRNAGVVEWLDPESEKDFASQFRPL